MGGEGKGGDAKEGTGWEGRGQEGSVVESKKILKIDPVAFTNTIFLYFCVLFIVRSLCVACILSCNN